MKSLKLVRRVLSDVSNCIVGHLFIDGFFFCTAIENLKHSVPSGTYPLDFTYSPKFKCKLPLLIVPHRSGIRIHAGNTSRDSSGCILVGVRDGYFSIKNSRDVLSRLLTEFSGQNIPKQIIIV